jgi:hypothetical protein
VKAPGGTFFPQVGRLAASDLDSVGRFQNKRLKAVARGAGEQWTQKLDRAGN